MSIINGRITSTLFGPEGHGILTFSLQLASASGWSQGFGGYPLKNPGCGALIERILHVCGVDSWESLPGTLVRIKDEAPRILGIGHIIEERWLWVEEIPKILEGGAR